MSQIRQACLVIAVLALGGTLACKDETLTTSKAKSNRQNTNGQTITSERTDGSNGASIFIPGSQSGIDADQLIIEEGPADIANQTTAAYLNVHGEVEAASAPILVTSSSYQVHEQVGSLILSIPIDDERLGLFSREPSNLTVF